MQGSMKIRASSSVCVCVSLRVKMIEGLEVKNSKSDVNLC